MKTSPFLVPPPQRLPENNPSGMAEEAGSYSSSRRSFIKRTGGATVAALVAAGLGTRNAYADYADDVIWSNFWSMIFDLFSDDTPPSTPPPSTPPPSTPPPPPSTPPPHEHEWQYTIEGEDMISYWGTKSCACGATGTFRSLKPNAA